MRPCWKSVTRPAQRSDGSDRGCPLATVIDRPMWHASGTGDEYDAARPGGRWHQLERWVRPSWVSAFRLPNASQACGRSYSMLRDNAHDSRLNLGVRSGVAQCLSAIRVLQHSGRNSGRGFLTQTTYSSALGLLKRSLRLNLPPRQRSITFKAREKTKKADTFTSIAWWN